MGGLERIRAAVLLHSVGGLVGGWVSGLWMGWWVDIVSVLLARLRSYRYSSMVPGIYEAWR